MRTAGALATIVAMALALGTGGAAPPAPTAHPVPFERAVPGGALRWRLPPPQLSWRDRGAADGRVDGCAAVVP